MKLVLALVYRKNIGVTNKIIIHNKEQIFSMMDEYFFSFFLLWHGVLLSFFASLKYPFKCRDENMICACVPARVCRKKEKKYI